MGIKEIRIFVLLLPFALLLSACSIGGSKVSVVKVGTTEIKVEVAKTKQEQEKGLSYRENLANDSGMLFVFDRKDRYSFWMKGMNFPLDFIWVGGNEVVELTENVPKPVDGREIPAVMPAEPVNNVVEVNAGFIRLNRVKVGDKFEVSSESR